MNKDRLKAKTVVCSSVGRKRKINQDNFWVNGFINEKGRKYVLKCFFKSCKEQIAMICDGMGGEQHGEIASYLASKKLESYKNRYSNLFNRFEEHVAAYTQSANKAICEYMSQHKIDRMGTTFALLCSNPETNEAICANIGDSKVFIMRKGILQKISTDHNQAQTLVNLGVISPEEALTHPDKSKLTQYLGIYPNELVIEPCVSDVVMLHRGDLFLLCSDGLTDMLTLEEITNILNNKKSLKKRAKQLIEKANENGGKDNITVVLQEF